MTVSTAPWWRLFPRESRPSRPRGPDDHPDPRFAAGAWVRLRGKPERARRVLSHDWHWHRQQFVYVVETSSLGFEPYWFAAQLEPAEESLR
jgi:hypothetical protein